MRGRRAMVARHLQRAHGGVLGPAELRREVRRTFDSYARYWVEAFRLPGLGGAELEAGMSVDGLDHLLAGVEAGHGVILALPHLGGWEFAGAWMGVSRGLPVTAVAEPLEPPELFEWFAELRRSLLMTIVPLGPSAGPALLGALRANQLVALLCDRNMGATGVEVEFFGERTLLPGGPATLALRSGAPILPTAAYFEGRGHRAVIRPPVPVERSGPHLRDDVARVTQRVAEELEGLIRRAPDQWHLMQPNWPSDPGYQPLLLGR